jgi:hypothetical protein
MEITNRSDSSQGFRNSCYSPHCTLCKREKVSPYIALTRHKALINAVMTYAYNFAGDSHVLKFTHFRSKVLHFIRSFPCRNRPAVCLRPSQFHTFEKLSQFLSRQNAEVIYNYHNRNVPVTGHGEGQHRRYEELKVGDSQACKLPND